MPLCCDCGKNVPKTSFAKSQLKKPQNKRRCMPCAKPLSTPANDTNPAPNNAIKPENNSTCWICLQSNNDEHGPPRRDCSCRGASESGYVHISCLIDMASKKSDSLDMENVSLGVSVGGNTINPWRECMTCRQVYSGFTLSRLATAMFTKYDTEDSSVFWKNAAYDNLCGVLISMSDYQGAEMVLEKRYKICVDEYWKQVIAGVNRSEIPCTRDIVSCCTQLAACYSMLRRYEDMPPKLDEAEKYAERVDEDKGGLILRANIWRSRAQYERDTDHPEKAMKLMQKVIPTLTKTPGYEGSFNNLKDRWFLSDLLMATGEYREGHNMMKETLEEAERILGGDHPFVHSKKDELKRYEKLGKMLEVTQSFEEGCTETIATGFLYTRQLVRLSRVHKSQGGYSGCALNEHGEWEKMFVPFPAVCLDEGTQVVLVDYEGSMKIRNGKHGVVTGFGFEDNQTHSFDALWLFVDLEDGKGEINVKPKNVMVDVPGVDFRVETKYVY